MKIIGITGGIGAGKSTVCNEFKKCGAKVIDADEISRKVTAKDGEAYSDIIEKFGTEILLESGQINRKALAKIVFSDKTKLSVLNSITHKYIFKKIKEEIDSSTEEIVVLDVPLLFSSDFPIECDIKIAVLADRDERIKRVKKRDGLNEEEIVARMNNQLSNDEYKRLADICIINKDFDDTQKQIQNILTSVRG